ncbi:hypothetical protein B0H14DRAFT_1100070 [Mycena olivaceomarginata]|nr:hypothetical protein B0H14DRAFT_1100070 [Mycena olivaceomarginata]
MQPLHTPVPALVLSKNIAGQFHKQQVHSTTFLPLLKNGAVKKVLAVSSGLGDLELTLAGELVTCAAQYKAEGSIFLRISPESWILQPLLRPHPPPERLKS